jgi:hypothetical protein
MRGIRLSLQGLLAYKTHFVDMQEISSEKRN